MRVVNDRRRLPRVAWTGEVVVHGRGGEVRCRAVDIGAGGMSVLSSSSGKTRERVRVHTQLGNFPLLADAVIVRTSRTKEGYRWGLRFERIDDTTRASLEGFVRQQLANAARVRQAQLYAARMKSAPLPGATPVPAWPTPVPTPAPVSVPPTPRAEPRTPEPPATGSTPLAIELPDLAPPVPVARRTPQTEAPPAYSPYGGQTDDDPDASLAALSDAPLTPAPSPPARATQPATPEPPVPQDAPAPAFDPGVADADEAEMLLGAPSDEPAVAPPVPTVTPRPAPEPAVAPAAAAPAKPSAAAPSAAAPSAAAPSAAASAKPAATVWELDPDALDDELSFAAVLAEADELAEQTPPQKTGPRTGDTVMLPPQESAPPTPAPFAAAGSPPPATQPEPLPVGPAVPAPTFSDADAAVVAAVDHDTSDSISLSDAEVEPAPGGLPAAALVGAPFDLGSDADDETLPLSIGPELGPTPVAAAAPQDSAPASTPPAALPATPAEPASPAPSSLSSSQIDPPADLPRAAETASPPMPTQDFGGLPFDAGPVVDAGSTEGFGAGLEISESDGLGDGGLGGLGPVEGALAEVAELPDRTEPVAPPATAALPSPTVETSPASVAPVATPRPAAQQPTAPAPPRGPAPPVYADVVAPYDPYGPSPEPVPREMAKHPDISSAPRTIGELPPAVEGLYTPASNPSLHGAGESGVYQSASFEPFPSPTEEGLYGGESTLSFEDRRDDPRQRLAKLQVKVAPKPAPDDDSSMYLGDIEGATSGLTPTHAKMLSTDEDLHGSPFVDSPLPDSDMPTSVHSAQDGVGAPDSLLAAMPTGPVDVGVADYTPAPYDPNDSAVGAPFGTHDAHPPEALATAPGFAIVPDYEQPPEPSGESDDPLRRPAQSGRTIVASTELLGLTAPSPDRAAAAPSDFEVLPAFSGQADKPSNFTMVAGFEDMASSTMIATAAQVDAWRRAEAAGPTGAFDDEANTSYFTPAPGSLAPIMPPDVDGVGAAEPETAVVGGPVFPAGLDDAELTAMRIRPGGTAAPSGAGFELNPRGPAQPQPAPVAPPSSTVGPGPSARRGTRLEQGGRPAPPPAPAQRRAPPQPPRGPGPAVLGSGQVGRSTSAEPVNEQAPTGPHGTVPVEAAKPAPTARRSLVEDALQQLKRRTDEKRKEKKPEPAAAAKDAKPAPEPKRRRRNLGKAEVSDPRIAELYHAALTDLSDKKVT